MNCPADFVLNRLDFAKSEFATASIQLMSLGAYLGILCDTKFFRGTHREVHNTSVVKGVLRCLVTLLLFSPFLLLINVDLLNSDNFEVILIVVYVLPAFFSGFFFFAFSRLIFKRCKLVTSDVD